MSYELKNTNRSSSILGNCEICGKLVVEVWHFCKFKDKIHPILKIESKIQLFDTYGHHRCIVEKHNLINEISGNSEIPNNHFG